MRYSERRYQYNVIGLYIHHLRDAGRDAWRHFIKRDVLYIIIDELIIETLDSNLVLSIRELFVSLQNTIV